MKTNDDKRWSSSWFNRIRQWWARFSRAEAERPLIKWFTAISVTPFETWFARVHWWPDKFIPNWYTLDTQHRSYQAYGTMLRDEQQKKRQINCRGFALDLNQNTYTALHSITKQRKKFKESLDHYTRCAVHCVHQFLVVIRKYADGMLINQKYLKCWSKDHKKSQTSIRSVLVLSVTKSRIRQKDTMHIGTVIWSTKEFLEKKTIGHREMWEKIHIEKKWNGNVFKKMSNFH